MRAEVQAAISKPQRLTDHLINVAPAVAGLIPAVVATQIHYTADFRLAYRGGEVAWATGRPMDLDTWMGMPFYGLVMALVSRTGPEFVTGRIFLALNLSLWIVMLAMVWPRLRPHVPAGWWWATLAAAALFAPALSTIFWLQINLVVFALALAGMALIGRHDRWAGVLIGLSLAIKPLVLLLPLALLLQRRTRAAAAWALVSATSSTVAAFVFFAWRAHDAAAMNPFTYLDGFVAKSRVDTAACIVENFSPVAQLCRLGLPPSSAETALLGLLTITVGWLMVRDLPDAPQTIWLLFAAACFLSILIGPIDWAHYGLLMGPLLLWLAYELWHLRAPLWAWLALIAAFAVAEFVWDPVSSQLGASVPLERFFYAVAQFSQWALLACWIGWRIRLMPKAQNLPY